MADKIPDNLRAFDDMDSARKWMRDGAIEALKKRFPIEDDTYRLELDNPRYDHEENEYGLKRQKEALLKRGYLADRVRGTWRLVNKQTGQVMDEKEATVMRVPYLTNRGTFIYNGNEYSAASQSRLKNGVYTRKRQSGEIESFYSIKPGTGRNFKMWMEPKTGVFRMNVGQANMPLYPLLKELGVTDKQIAASWGPEVAAANANSNYDVRDMRRYYEKFMGKSPGNLGDTEVREAVRNAVTRAEVDPWVVSRTLGLDNVSHVSPEMLLRGSQKILNVSRGEEQPDDRNAPMFSRILAPEDFIRERIENDAGRVARTLLFKSRRAGNLSRVPAGALDSYTKEYLIKSRLTQPLEETNPLSLLEQMSRVTRMGEGGIGSAEAVTADARDVNLGQLGFIDPIQGPECIVSGSYIKTYGGFKPVEDMTTSDYVWARPDGSKPPEYTRPHRVIIAPYEGDIYVIDHPKVTFRGTPNHRFYCRLPDEEQYDFRYIADLKGLSFYVLAGENFTDPVLIEPSNVFVEPFNGTVYCIQIAGGLMYARYGEKGEHWTGNSETIGIDTRVSHRTFKGKDGQMYGEFRDARTGKMAYLKPEDVADKAIAFPGEMASKKPTAYVSYQGKIQEVPKDRVDLEVPSFGHMMSAMTNLNPMPTSVQAARQFYGSKFWGQYMPATKGELPLVDSVMDDGQSFSEYYGRRVGSLTAKKAGKVISIDDDTMKVKYEDGTKGEIDLVKNLPMNRLTQMSYDTQLKPGDSFKAGDLLATNNFVDPKTGAFAMGHNLKVAVVPYKGYSHEDAQVFSESAAKRLSTNRLYGYDQDFDNDVKVDYKKFTALFPDKFTKEQLKGMGDNGVVKPGTTLNYGDPIILGVGPKLLGPEDAQLGKLSKALRHAQTDKSTVWEHQYPGIVTDAEVTNKGVSVNVKADVPLQVGDKTCYSSDTEVLTLAGWKNIADVSFDDGVATLNPETMEFEYLHPEALQKYRHDGPLYHMESQQIDAFVTGNHNMFVQRRGKTHFELVHADDIFGKRVSYKKDGKWNGIEPDCITIPGCMVGHRWGEVWRPDIRMKPETYMMLLGMFISEGNCVDNKHSSTYGIEICQIKPSNVEKAKKAFMEAGIDARYETYTHKFHLYGKPLLNHFKQFGYSHEKFLPPFVFSLSSRLQRILFDWLMWGDGHCKSERPVIYTTASKRLADDIQRLCLHIGYAGNIRKIRYRAGRKIYIHDHEATSHYDIYDVAIITKKLTPTVNHGHVKSQKVQNERYEDYHGFVHCCTMPKWNVIYVRRNGKAFWCGNSTRYGLKGVCGRIVPDDQMPRDPLTNEPYDVLLNPMTILSRVAPNQLMEIGLGKVAKHTGQQYRIPQLPPQEGWAQWTLNQMQSAGIPEKEDLFDPETGKTIKGIMTGYMYTLPFHHLSEKKLSGRGSSGVSYSSDELPVKGGGEGAQAKRMSGMDNTALICHGALDVLKDSQVIRGAKNEDYWKALKLGRPLPEPQVPFVYNKFMNLMKAGGINVMKRGSNNLDLLPMTDKDIEQLSGGAIDDGQMVDKDMNPVKGGLFDTAKAGGLLGKKWTHVDLSEPMPNPVFEEPIRRLLGLSQKQFRAILSGREDLDGEYGGKAFQKALAKIDVDKEIAHQKQILQSSKASKRDNAVKCLGYLTALKKQELTPKDWVITKVPVLPPVFRPVSRLGDTLLQADINELYRDVIESSKSLSDLRKDLPDRDLQDERETLYDSIQAAFGLGDPITPEGAAKGLKGALRTITGNGSPKFGFYQSRVLSKPMDMVGRGAISPNPNLDMDTIGIPEDKAWELYKDFVLRRLTQNNIPGLRALEMIENREPAAKQALMDELAYRPVLMDRAPTWHKFNILAYRPYLSEGATVRVSPLILQGMNGDFDGDYQTGIVFVAIGSNAPQSLRDQLNTLGEGETVVAETRRNKVLVKDRFTVYPLDLQDFPHGTWVGRRKDDNYDIDFYEVPKGIHVFAYDEQTRKIVLAEVAGWSEHHNRPMEIVTLSGGEQIYTDDDPRGVYCIDPFGKFGFEMSRMTPSQALERGVFVPVSSQPIVSAKPKLRLDPKTQTLGDTGLDMNWNLGVVVGIVATRGEAPSRATAKAVLSDMIESGVISRLAVSKLSLSIYNPRPFDRHLPCWFHSGSKDFLLGLINGIVLSLGSISMKSKKNGEELLISVSSTSLRLLRETRRVLRMLGVHSKISFARKSKKNGDSWLLNISSLGAKRARLFKKIPDETMRKIFNDAEVDLEENSSLNDIIPLPDVARKAITRWISQKKHCNLYHTIFESFKRGGYITRSCGFRVKEIAEKMQEKYVADFDKARSALDKLIEKVGESVEPLTPPAKLQGVVMNGIEAVSPYSAYGAGDDKVREARKYARWLSGPIYPDVLHELARFFNSTSPCRGLAGDPQYKLLVGMLENPVTWHKVIKVEKTEKIETGYDLTVPGYETFMSDEGVVLSNTVNFHVPVSDKAVKNALDKMLPSKNLISLTDLRESMSNPRQEMALGLYALTRAPSRKAPVRFRTAEEAKAAYRAGKIAANDPIIIG